MPDRRLSACLTRHTVVSIANSPMLAAAMEDPRPPDMVVPPTVDSLMGVHPTETRSMEGPRLLGMVVVPPMAANRMEERPMEESMVAHIRP